MSIKNGVWHDAVTDPPHGDQINKTVLIVKANKSGQRSITFGAYMASTQWEGTWTTNNGKGTVLYWLPLPEIPEV